MAPSATPPDVIAKLRNSYLAAIENAEIKRQLMDAGIDILQSNSSEFADYMLSETTKWNAVVKSANIHAD